ncbi:MAG: DUF2147 domain-containing protein, partial [Bacteroidia bacterium]|nr:DUF2147 domain-containing protein [Bacteroidia bacterium]
MTKPLTIILLFLSFICFSSSSTIVGTWQTIGDYDGKPKSLVKIYKGKNGKYYGKILEYIDPQLDTNEICAKCPKEDYRYNQRVVGMNIITGLTASEDLKSASGGKVLHPPSGKIYNFTMKLIENGTKMEVRGYLGFELLGRSQTWIR